MRTAAGEAALGAQGQCTTTAIELEFGHRGDPALLARLTVIKDWIWMWTQASGSHKVRLRRTWQKVRKVLRSRHRWKRVRGPLAATIATLYDMGWTPIAPDTWREPGLQGDIWSYQEDMDASAEEICELIEKHIKADLWQQASKFQNGKGLEEGVDFTVTRRHLQKLRDQELEGKATILTKATCAASWTRARKFEAKLIDSPVCLRCGEESEDDFHRVWGCKANGDIKDPSMKWSRELLDKAKEGKESHPCFWSRGLTPSSWTQPSAPSDSPCTYAIGDERWWAGRFYLDGSGGRATSDRRRRRAGWAAVNITPEEWGMPQLHQVLFGPLGGPKQTVPRAELTAAIRVLDNISGEPGLVELMSDCAYVVKGFRKVKDSKGNKKTWPKGNRDLWEELVEAMKEKEEVGFTVSIDKVKAHADLVDIMVGRISWADFSGNCMADAFAAEAAAMHAVKREENKRIREVDEQAWQIQDRIIATTIDAMQKEEALLEGQVHPEGVGPEERRRRRKRFKEKKEEIQEEKRIDKENKQVQRGQDQARRIEESGHEMDIITDMYTGGKRKRGKETWRCSRCLGSRAASALDSWLAEGRCPAAAEDGEGQGLHPLLPVQLHRGLQGELQHGQGEGEVLEGAHQGDDRQGDFHEVAEEEPMGDLDELVFDEDHPQGEQQVSYDEPDVFGFGHLGFDDDDQVGPHQEAPKVAVDEPHVEALPQPQPTETARQRLDRLRASAKAKKNQHRAVGGVPRSQLVIGRQALHSSHKLHHKRGVVWCWRCGAYGTESLIKLAKVCDGETSRGTEGFLSRLKLGLTPRDGLEWPMELGVGPPEGPVLDC